MKTLFNKITKNIILPLVVAGGIEGTAFCQKNSDISSDKKTAKIIDYHLNKRYKFGAADTVSTTPGSFYTLRLYNVYCTRKGRLTTEYLNKDHNTNFEEQTIKIFDKKNNLIYIDSKPCNIPLKYMIVLL